MDADDQISILNVHKEYRLGVINDITTKTEDVWKSLLSDADVRAEFRGIVPKNPPVVFEPLESNSGFIEAIAVAVASGLAKDAATVVWKTKIWPLLKKQLSDEIEEQ